MPPPPPLTAIKDRIVDAFDQLFVSGWEGACFTGAQAARNLVDLAGGATLGEEGREEGGGASCGDTPDTKSPHSASYEGSREVPVPSLLGVWLLQGS
jgi:hypothetical protein